MKNFWQQLNKPIFCLAPMEEVTDVAFREMFALYSNSEKREKRKEKQNSFVMFTEFINVDGLTHPVGFEKLKLDLKYTENQRPIVAQIWGTKPEKFYEATKKIVEMGFDGVDINMGCPQDKEIGIGACAALIRTPNLAKEIVEATIKAAGELPVSVKTRIGYTKADEMEAWVTTLLSLPITTLTLHARTKQEKSKVPAQWEKIAEAVRIRDKMQVNREKDKTLIIGNGDVKSYEEGLARIKETGCDGVMIARGAFGNPWLFRLGEEKPNSKLSYEPTTEERLKVMIEHAEYFDKEFNGIKSFHIMRKHFKAYASGFPGSHELRAKLMEVKNLDETKKVVAEFLSAQTVLR